MPSRDNLNNRFKAIRDFLETLDPSLSIEGVGLNFVDLAIDIEGLSKDTLTYCQSQSYLESCSRVPQITAIFCKFKDFQNLKNSSRHLLNEKTFILTKDPKNLFFKLHNHLVANALYSRKDFETYIHPKAKISAKASIANMNVLIGEGTIIEDFAVIKENVSIGKNCRIQSGAIIGNDCLQCGNSTEGVYDVLHSGGVVIEDNVKVESNALICRHIFNNNTYIGQNVKIGGLAHVTHGCSIGNNSIIAPNVFIGGGSTLGEWCFVGANASIVPMMNIGNRVKISSGAVITTAINDNMHYSGNFAIEHNIFKTELINVISKHKNV